MADDDYASRAQALGLDSPQVIQSYLALPNVVILDVRTDEEIAEDRIETDNEAAVAWLKSGCTVADCPVLESNPESLVPDKATPIVIHCKSGRRAVKAKEILLRKGYMRVVNAGGLEDLRALYQPN